LIQAATPAERPGVVAFIFSEFGTPPARRLRGNMVVHDQDAVCRRVVFQQEKDLRLHPLTFDGDFEHASRGLVFPPMEYPAAANRMRRKWP